MWVPPLLIIPLLIYNAVAFDVVGTAGMSWAEPVMSLSMLSGAVWTVNVSDLLVVVALVLLMVDGLRTRQLGRRWSGTLVAAILFFVYLGEFLLVPLASTSLFFTCLAMSFVDLVTKTFARIVPRKVELPVFEDEHVQL